ncbi:lytic transglycosylase domain-containing protein [Actinomycetospora atypica]|uniref:Lytic transglycosylase domain-containing protein n=1 Tax=Actinomycetospora atypica TaxID=1290095 RepID=A0ABV9YIL6_9PSEU
MGDERGPWIGSAWMVSTEAGPARAPRPRVLLSWGVGLVVMLGALGAAGPAAPVTAALTLPPPDTSEIGATGRVPEAGVPPVPGDLLPPGLPDLGGTGTGSLGGADSGIPETVLAAYRGAETAMGRTAPGCGLTWPLVAGIGKVESSHAYGGSVDASGTTTRPILGPALNGTGGNASITDTDGGALDGDTTWDRAVGPTQFIPTSWEVYGADGNGDGRSDPDNVHDAALATGRYLCAGGTDLDTPSGRHDAVFRYNHSESYVATVLRWADGYASGALPVPDSTGGIPDPAPASDPGSDILAAGSPARLAALPQPLPTTPGPGSAPPPGLLGGSPVAAPGPGAPAPLPVAAGAALSSGASSSSVAAPPVVALPERPPSPARPEAGTTTPAAPTTPRPTTPGPTTTTPAPPSTTTTTAPPTTTTTAAAAARCQRSLPTVAKAFAVPVAQLTAATGAGPKAGQVTCTVSRSGKPLVVAVVATTASAPAPTAPAGVHRAAAGGRVMLAVPPGAGVPDATARTALASLAAAWG